MQLLSLRPEIKPAWFGMLCRKYKKETSFQVAAAKSFPVHKFESALRFPIHPSVADSFPPPAMTASGTAAVQHTY
jgi:hypothetical protein